MKRKRAIILFGSIAVATLGYVAWCARSMYLSVPVPELLELPEEYRADARALVVKHGLTRPDRFGKGAFVELLLRPYDSAPKGIVSFSNPPPDPVSRIVVARDRRRFYTGDRDLAFQKSEGGWKIEVMDMRTPLPIEDRELIATPP